MNNSYIRCKNRQLPGEEDFISKTDIKLLLSSTTAVRYGKSKVVPVLN
jgi:hypothetical protein